MFQPLSGPGFKVNKRGIPLEQLRAEIAARIAALPPPANKAAVPVIVPSDRGRTTANWHVEAWVGIPATVQAAILAVMREFEIEEP